MAIRRKTAMAKETRARAAPAPGKSSLPGRDAARVYGPKAAPR